MSNNFYGSIAQKNVSFPIETVIEPLAGENFARAMIFAPSTKAGDYYTGEVTTGTVIELNAGNYSALTSGTLKDWLVPFFKSAESGIIGLVFYTTSDPEDYSGLTTAYEKTKLYAYFKFILNENTDAQVALAKLCNADSEISTLWVGTSDSNILSTTETTIVEALSAVQSNARVIYNVDSSINPALAQLGKTLATINATGTPIGNSVDMVAFSTIKASGSDGGNLSTVDCTTLDGKHVGYNTYVGDGTDNVVTEGSLSLQGESVGAEWVKNYITYLCRVQTASYISKMNVFRNNGTYKAILLILRSAVKSFVEMGRLTNFEVTAPEFSELPSGSDKITVPNAWQADYVDNVRSVTIYGTLYIPSSSR